MAVLDGLFKSWALKRYQKLARGHLAHLRRLDDDGLGLILAIVAHQRNTLSKEGLNLRDLTTTSNEHPMCHDELSKAAQELAKKRQPHDALGMHIWAHSLRGVGEPALRQAATQIWTELMRGEHRVAAARKLIRKETGVEIDISMAKEIPKEFV